MGAPDEFHDDVHPDATEITGDRKYGEWGQCTATAKSADRRCRGYAQGPHGKCNTHGGKTDDDKNDKRGRGDQTGNTNAVSHELYSDSNLYYQRRDEAGQAMIDGFFDDYAERYVNRHGQPPRGDIAMLFKVAVNLHKIVIKADEWPRDKPDSLDANNSLIDRSQKVTPQGDTYYEYVVTAIDKAEHRLSTRTRQWLKDNNLTAPADDGADVEVNISERMWNDLTDYYATADTDADS